MEDLERRKRMKSWRFGSEIFSFLFPLLLFTLILQDSPKYSSLRDQLMFAEKMEEVPDDLLNWKLVWCPSGKRCLVIASKGRTKAYLRNGFFDSFSLFSFPLCLNFRFFFLGFQLKTFSSPLPGGSR